MQSSRIPGILSGISLAPSNCDIGFMLAGLMHSSIRGRNMWPTTSRFLGSFALVSVYLVMCQSPYLIAQAEVIRIEEHWELAITEADSQTNAGTLHPSATQPSFPTTQIFPSSGCKFRSQKAPSATARYHSSSEKSSGERVRPCSARQQV